MTRAAFEKLKTQALIDYLIAEGVELDDRKQATFRQQEIDGEVLLDWAREDLERAGFPMGLATKIMKRIPSPSATTRAAIEKLKVQEVVDYLLAHDISLNDKEQGIFREHKIDGSALVQATAADLERAGLPVGVLLNIRKKIFLQ